MPTTDTFEQFAARFDLPADDPRHDLVRAMWEEEQEAQATEPAVVPPCPSWCTLAPNHPYEGYWGDGVHTRMHAQRFGGVEVTAMERNGTGGLEPLHEYGVSCAERLEFVSAERAREVASDLLLAADLLDGVAPASRPACTDGCCPR